MYKRTWSTERANISIDSTGSLVYDINGKTIFFHVVSVNYSGGQFSTTQMFSEESHAQASGEWLGRWRKMGAPKPHTCTTDRSRALFNAVTQVFTRFKYIDQIHDAYADSLMNEETPQDDIFLRIDTPHFMNNYKKFT